MTKIDTITNISGLDLAIDAALEDMLGYSASVVITAFMQWSVTKLNIGNGYRILFGIQYFDGHGQTKITVRQVKW